MFNRKIEGFSHPGDQQKNINAQTIYKGLPKDLKYPLMYALTNNGYRPVKMERGPDGKTYLTIEKINKNPSDQYYKPDAKKILGDLQKAVKSFDEPGITDRYFKAVKDKPYDSNASDFHYLKELVGIIYDTATHSSEKGETLKNISEGAKPGSYIIELDIPPPTHMAGYKNRVQG